MRRVVSKGSHSARAFVAHRRSARHHALLLLVLVALAACSTVQLAYDNADWFLVRQMDRYLDLDSTQRATAGELLQARMEAHRRAELPLYVETLRAIRSMVADGLSADEVDWIFERVTTLYQDTMRGTLPAVTAVLASLTPAQVDHLERVLHEKNREFREEYLPASLDERDRGRTERAVEAIERWTGTLSDTQVALVARQRQAMPQTGEDWLAYNIRNQRKGLRLLREQASEPELRRFLNDWWVEYAGLPPELAAKLETAVTGWKSLFLAIDRSASPKQRRRVLRKLDGFIEALDKLTDTLQATSSGGRATGNT